MYVLVFNIYAIVTRKKGNEKYQRLDVIPKGINFAKGLVTRYLIVQLAISFQGEICITSY